MWILFLLPAAFFYPVFCPQWFCFPEALFGVLDLILYLIHSHTFKCGFSLQPDFVFLIPALTMLCIVNFLLFLSPWNPGSPIAPQTLISNSLSTPVPCLGSQKNIQIHPPKTKPPIGKTVPATPSRSRHLLPRSLCVSLFLSSLTTLFPGSPRPKSLQTSSSSFCTWCTCRNQVLWPFLIKPFSPHTSHCDGSLSAIYSLVAFVLTDPVHPMDCGWVYFPETLF